MKIMLYGGRMDGDRMDAPGTALPAKIQIPMYADRQWRELQADGRLRGDDPFGTVDYVKTERIIDDCAVYAYNPPKGASR